MSRVFSRFFAMMALLQSTAVGGEPRIETMDLFEAGTGGYALYRIPGLVVTPKGTILAYCEARKSTRGDWGTTDIMMRRGTDGGRNWTAAAKIVEPPADAQKNPVAIEQSLGKPGEITANNPVAIVERRSGDAHMLYCIEYARCFHMTSHDDGATFGEAREITSAFDAFRPEYSWRVLATGPGHGIELSSGRLLVPVWLSTGTGGHGHRPSAVATIYSDDQGKTWKRGAIVVKHPQLANPSETAAVELADGRVMLNIRHESEPHQRAISISPDGISRWSELRFDAQLPEPVCFGSLARFSLRSDADRNRLLFVNPHNPDGRERRNLTVKLSYDEGQTWPVSRSVEAGPSGYADLAAGPGGSIACLYERGTTSQRGFTPRSLCLVRFNLEWLTGSRDTLGRPRD